MGQRGLIAFADCNCTLSSTTSSTAFTFCMAVIIQHWGDAIGCAYDNTWVTLVER